MTAKRHVRFVTEMSLPGSMPYTWQLLTTPAVMSDCMPGLLTWRAVKPNQVFRLVLAWAGEASLGSQGRIPVTLEWTALRPPVEMEIAAEIQFGDQIIPAHGAISLTQTDEKETALILHGEVETDNPLLRRLIAGAAPKLMDRFFRRLKAHMEADANQTDSLT